MTFDLYHFLVDFKTKPKNYILDGLANLIVSVSVGTFILGVLAHWNLDQYIVYWITSPIFAFTVGPFFGRFLNIWRKVWRYK